MKKEKLASYDLPDAPGVYFFLGSPKRSEGGKRGKEILYIGKATSLQSRVRSYFSADLADKRSPAIAAMVEYATALSFTPTNSVLEALILEAALIKKHQPRYNTDAKDDKSWNYVVITKEAYPRILLKRSREFSSPSLNATSYKLQATFGPFPHGGQLKEALRIIRKIFPYSDNCTPCVALAKQGKHCKPCFNAQLGLCPGVCSGAMGKIAYARRVRDIADFFSGNFKGVKRRLARDMKKVALAEDFEQAEKVRRQIFALEHIRDVALIKTEVGDGKNTKRLARIEAFDTAHTAGKETVGVMAVVEGGETVVEEYRKFIIRSVTNNDVGALTEILERRLAHSEWPLPRLFVVDGGAAQRNAAEALLKKIGISVPVVGVVKDEAHRPREIIGDKSMARTHEKDILLANAEAHRTAITWHRKRLRKRMLY